MLHWRHTTLDILFVLPPNHGSWKFHSGYLCMLLVCTRLYLIEAKFTKESFSLGGTEI